MEERLTTDDLLREAIAEVALLREAQEAVYGALDATRCGAWRRAAKATTEAIGLLQMVRQRVGVRISRGERDPEP